MLIAAILLMAAESSAQTECAPDEERCFEELYQSWQDLDDGSDAKNPYDRFDGHWNGDEPVYPWDAQEAKFTWLNDSGYYWINAKDIRQEGGAVTAWVNSKLIEPMANGTSHLLTRLTFNCEGQFRYSAQTAYSVDGLPIIEIDRVEDWKYVRPGSAFDTYQQALCAEN